MAGNARSRVLLPFDFGQQTDRHGIGDRNHLRLIVSDAVTKNKSTNKPCISGCM